MGRNIAGPIFILLATVGCTSRQPRPRALPSPVSPQPTTRTADNSPWAFTYRSDTIRLQINRSAAIESTGDSAKHREISTNNTHEILALLVNGDTIRYSATVDSFSTASQGLLGPVQAVSLPVQVSGTLGSPAILDSLTQTCNPVETSLEGDVRNFLVSFPQQLTSGHSWKDSVTHVVCYGGIPMATVVVRNFSIAGQTSFNGQAVIAIHRIDSISARGEGRQQQHQLTVDVHGTGNAAYSLSTELGRVLHLTISQELDFSIRAGSRTNQFHESVKEEFNSPP